MPQEDFLKRDIEKIGMIMTALRQKLFGSRGGNTAIAIENPLQQAKNVLLEDLGFDLELFIHLNQIESQNYLTQFSGFNVENIETLAGIISDIGLHQDAENKVILLENAVHLYAICSIKDKAYSLEREAKIADLKHILQNLT